MDMEYGLKEILMKNMKASFYKIENKVMEYIHGTMVMSIKVIIKLI